VGKETNSRRIFLQSESCILERILVDLAFNIYEVFGLFHMSNISSCFFS